MGDEKPIINYSEAIERGVSNWLEANKEAVMSILKDATQTSVEYMAAGSMKAVGEFLDKNKDDLKAGIAVAIATSWAARQHPVPK